MPFKPKPHRPARPHNRVRRAEDRPTAAQRGYGARWQKARLVYLQEHPLCECDECKELGRVLPAEVIDHVVAHRGDAELFWDESNWRAMAKRCHDRKTARGE